MGTDFLKDNSELIDKLKQIPVLEEFSDADLQELLQMAKLKQFRAWRNDPQGGYQ